MRTILLFFAWLASVSISAQTLDVTITAIDLSKKTITCDLSWTGRSATRLSDVWVFVDYIDVSGNILTNDWKSAAVTGATITQQTTGSATVDKVSGNTRGIWVKSTASGADFTGQILLQLSGVPDKFNPCAYATDYPPNTVINNGTYILQGSPPFTLIAADGRTQQVNGDSIAVSAVNIAPVTLTDKTGCPGILLCPYPGSDLFIDTTHFCRQRTAGKKNWEAWIKDARDSKLYRVVLMPDNKWWLAQNLKYDITGSELLSTCGEDSCGRFYKKKDVFNPEDYKTNLRTICPDGWILPSTSQWDAMAKAIDSDLVTAWSDLRSLQTPCSPRSDQYGWAARGKCPITIEIDDGDSWHSSDRNKWIVIQLDNGGYNSLKCNNTSYWHCTNCRTDASAAIAVRCIYP
ncbi:MAG: hypothetical protein LBB31_04380 [Prevotellaceae bacterium]|jgi:uncharacterized protein (TIGR02145 family)|nr:hypothetical protein [Prevotellaceae bacterium]